MGQRLTGPILLAHSPRASSPRPALSQDLHREGKQLAGLMQFRLGRSATETFLGPRQASLHCRNSRVAQSRWAWDRLSCFFGGLANLSGEGQESSHLSLVAPYVALLLLVRRDNLA